jgi:nucleoside-diphosphate-sugar epimerase
MIVTAPRSELGRAIARARAPKGAGHTRPVVLAIAAQPANTLLHDGRAWERLTPARLVREARNALRNARAARADFVVYASYAFLRAVENGAKAGDKLLPIAEAALEAESAILDQDIPACVVRLGYLYGPECRELRAYRLAFRIGRPYWAGPRRHLQHFLHVDDAVRSLLLAARRKPERRVVYATDERPVSFATFMDSFARLAGNPLPLHLPSVTRRLSHLVVAEEHMQMVELGVHGPAHPRLAGFHPRFADYRAGLRDVFRRWDG